jgi:uncharacterized protein with von Willebrand factor type A (vWA) domain
MFTGKEIPTHQRLLESELERSLRNLNRSPTDSEEYQKNLASVERLHKMLPAEKASVSKDTLVSACTNILGIMLIIKHEHVNVVTSKALSFVTRLR